MKLHCEYTDENGVRKTYKLRNCDMIDIDRCVTAFSFSHVADYVKMSVREALKSGAFDSENGTVRVSAKIKFHDGTVGSVWAVRN